METVINVCLTGAGEQAGCGKAPADRGSGKPQQRFADTPVLADVTEEFKPAQNRSKTSNEAGSQGQQAISVPAGSKKRSTEDSRKETAPIGSVLGWPGPMLVAAAAGKAVIGSTAALSAVGKGHTGETAVGDTFGAGLPAASNRKASVSPQSPVIAAMTAKKNEAAVISKVPRTEAGQSEGRAAKPVNPEMGVRVVHGPPETDVKATEAIKKDAPAPDGRVLPPQAKQAQVAVAAGNRTEGASVPQSPGEKPQTTGAVLPAAPKPSQQSQPLPAAPKPDQPLGRSQPTGEQPAGNVPKASGQRIEGPSGAPETPSERRVAVGGTAAQTAQGEVVQPVVKEARPDSPKGTPHTQSELPTFASAEPVASMARAPAQSQMSMSTDPGAARSPAQSLGEQILESMQASLTRGDRQVLVRLHPPELGAVLVRFREDGRQISAVLEAARGDTRREVEQALPGVVRGLQDAGVQVKRFEVVTSDLPEKDFARGTPQQDGWTQHQGASQDREHLTASPQARWSQADPDHPRGSIEESVGTSHSNVADGRIDMLL